MSVVRILIIIVLFAVALEGWLRRAVPIITRIALFLTAILIPFAVSSKLMNIVIGLGLLICLFLFQPFIKPKKV